MHHTNADAPLDGSPRRVAAPGGQPRPVGAPEKGAPAGERAPAPGRRMPTTLSGYEQILAARAAMRAQVERAAAVDRRGFIPPAPAKGSSFGRPRRRRAWPRRRTGLVLSGLAAAPLCALIALAWVEPPRTPGALPAGPAPAARISPPAFEVAAGTAAPTAGADGPAPAPRASDAPVWTSEVETGAPRGNAPPGSDPWPEHAEVEPSPPPAGHAEPSLASRDRDAPSPAAHAETGEAPPRSEASWSTMPGRAEAEERRPAPAVAAAETEEEPAPVPVVAAAAEEEPAPAVAVAEETGDDGAGAGAVAAASTAESGAAPVAFPATADADTAGVRGVRQEAPPAPIPAPTAAASLGTAPALPVAKAAAPAGPPSPPPGVRAAPAKSRIGEPPPPARVVRAADGASPSAEARCRAIIVKFQLGEETSHADRSFLQTSCGARRR